MLYIKRGGVGRPGDVPYVYIPPLSDGLVRESYLSNQYGSRLAWHLSTLALECVEYEINRLMHRARFWPIFNGSLERLALDKACILKWRLVLLNAT